MNGGNSWTTADEIAALKYMAQAKKKTHEKEYEESSEIRKSKLNTWLDYSYCRRFEHGVNLVKCQDIARGLLKDLDS